MINHIMMKSGTKAYFKDLKRLDNLKMDLDICEEKNISYMKDNTNEHMLDVYYKKDGKAKPILVDIHGGGFISHDKMIITYLEIM